MKDKKHLGTIHSSRQINEYYHVRTKTAQTQQFHFEVVQITPNNTRTITIQQSELPKEIINSLR
jgi:hypothetical protein